MASRTAAGKSSAVTGGVAFHLDACLVGTHKAVFLMFEIERVFVFRSLARQLFVFMPADFDARPDQRQ